MADNYLEKRMEELRSGALGGKGSGKRTGTGVKQQNGKGLLSFPFPPKCIVIVEPYSNLALKIASYYHAVGCRVAILGQPEAPEEKELEKEYRDLGIRIIQADLGDESPSATKSITDLLRDWKKIDIILDFSSSNRDNGVDRAADISPCSNISDNVHPSVIKLTRLISAYLFNYPAPTDYSPRIISIFIQDSPITKIDNSIFNLKPIERFLHFAVKSGSGYGAESILRQQILFLSLPQISNLNLFQI